MADNLSDNISQEFSQLFSEKQTKHILDNPNALEKANNMPSSTEEELNAKEQAYAKIKSNKIKSSNVLNGSLFDKYAIIDYGRYSKTTAWESYKSNDGGQTFIQNDTTSSYSSKGKSEEITIQKLVTWSEKYPALQLRYQDFVYNKMMGYFPNNRLIVVRRFKSGVPDNLFDHYVKGDIEATQPLSTMVTWLKPDETPITINYNENWESNNSGLTELLAGITTGQKELGGTGNFIKHKLMPVAMEAFGVKREDGLSWMDNEPGGDPNLIGSSQERKVAGAGLSSTINFSVEFDYELRYINGVDPTIAMLDLISNCLRMGTSTARFYFPSKALKESEFISKTINSNLGDLVKSFEENIGTVLESFNKGVESLVSDAKDYLTNAVSTKTKGVKTKTDTKTEEPSKSRNLKEVTNKTIKWLISRYRERFKSAFAADTGSPSGVWHVTIGNPMNPIVSCGDLIPSGSNEIKMGTELGYNDFPTSFKCKINLTSARARGRDELERIFNSGRGRFYVYTKQNQNPDNFLSRGADSQQGDKPKK
jgi:hypothetical protein